MPSPYVDVGCEGKIYKTATQNRTLDPQFHEHFDFQVADENSAQIHFRVYNKCIASDDFMGEYYMSVSGLIRGVPKEEWALLVNAKSGELHVQLVAEDFGAIGQGQPFVQQPQGQPYVQQQQYPQGQQQQYPQGQQYGQQQQYGGYNQGYGGQQGVIAMEQGVVAMEQQQVYQQERQEQRQEHEIVQQERREEHREERREEHREERREEHREEHHRR